MSENFLIPCFEVEYQSYDCDSPFTIYFRSKEDALKFCENCCDYPLYIKITPKFVSEDISVL